MDDIIIINHTWTKLLVYIDNQHKGYGFIQYEEIEDCDAAIDNMHLAELNGKVIKVNKAKAQRVVAGSNRAGMDSKNNAH